MGRAQTHLACIEHRRRYHPDQHQHHRSATRTAAPMNLEYSTEQRALADTVGAFLAEKAGVTEHVRALLDDPRGTTDPVWHGLAALGATGLLVAPEYGGSGATMVDAGIVAEALGAAVNPGPWLSCAAASRALLRFGREAQATE